MSKEDEIGDGCLVMSEKSEHEIWERSHVGTVFVCLSIVSNDIYAT